MNRFIPRYGTIVCQLTEEDNQRILPKYNQLSSKANGFRKLLKRLVKPNMALVEYIDKKIKQFEIERYSVWWPIFSKYGLPWRQGFIVLPNHDGRIYIALEFVPEELVNSYYKGAKKMKNINDNKPVDGTIIGKLTQDEIKALMELEAIETAINNISITVSNVRDFDAFLTRF